MGSDRLYIGPGNAGYETLKAIYAKKAANAKSSLSIEIDRTFGTVTICEEHVDIGDGILDSPVLGLPRITENVVVTVNYKDPKYDVNFIFPAVKLEGVVDPPRVLKAGGSGNQGEYNQQGSPYRPYIGFNRNDSGARLGAAGHRMMNPYMGGQGNQRGGGGYHQQSYTNRNQQYGGYQQQQQQNQSRYRPPYSSNDGRPAYNSGRGGGGGGSGGSGGYQGGQRNQGGGNYGSHQYGGVARSHDRGGNERSTPYQRGGRGGGGSSGGGGYYSQNRGSSTYPDNNQRRQY